jgi:hypothetical protein
MGSSVSGLLTPSLAQNSTDSSQHSKYASVGWQANPSRRGTLQIVENCIFTIFACTWSIQHLNLPEPHARWLTKLSRKCKWALLTIFFPEFLLAQSISEFRMAWRCLEIMDKSGVHVAYPRWHFPRKGLKSKDEAVVGESQWTLTHSYYANMGGFRLCKGAADTKILSISQLAKHWKAIEKRELSEDDIKNKSKTDYFAKSIAIVQISSLLLSILARVRRRLDFSQLELVTMAFAICGVFTYVFRWYKPQGIETATHILAEGSINKAFDDPGILHYDRFWHVVRHVEGDTELSYMDRVPNDYLQRAKRHISNSLFEAFLELHPVLYSLTIITIVFGCIHLIAWNFEFPSHVEKILWRTAALVSIGLPPVTLLVVPISAAIYKRLVSLNKYKFMAACLIAVREFAWESSDGKRLDILRQQLEKLEKAQDDLEMVEQQNYKDIFGLEENKELLKHLCDFIHKEKDRFSKVFPDFPKQFERLLAIMHDDAYPNDTSRLDLYPQLRLRWPSTIISAAGIVYCAARLSVIVLAFSSLRSMPDSVYVTTWAKNIPDVQ